MIVAIDGPAGSGKSTTARRVADALGWLYLDTGAMYRAAALAFLDTDVPFETAGAERILPGLSLDLHRDGDALRVFVNGDEVTDRIRAAEVSKAASRVSTIPSVRARMVDVQRRIAREQIAAGGGVVMEGRDIGTVVFPDAGLKVFMVADVAERAQRRHQELQARGEIVTLDVVAKDIAARDARDADREIAPLKQALDAVVLDTTGLTIDDQVAFVIALVRERADGSLVESDRPLATKPTS